MQDYFGGLGGHKPEAPAQKKAIAAKEHGAPGKKLTFHVEHKGGKIHSSIDHGDGLPADQMEHDTPEDAAQAHLDAMKQEFSDGDADDQQPAEKPKHSGGDYMSKMREME